MPAVALSWIVQGRSGPVFVSVNATEHGVQLHNASTGENIANFSGEILADLVDALSQANDALHTL